MIAALILMPMGISLCEPLVSRIKDYKIAYEVTYIIKPGCPANGVAFLRFSSKLGPRVPTTGFIELNRINRTQYTRLVPKWWVTEYRSTQGGWACLKVGKIACPSL